MSYAKFIRVMPLASVEQLAELHPEILWDDIDINQLPINQVLQLVEEMVAEFDTASGYIIDQDKEDYTKEELNSILNQLEQWIGEYLNSTTTCYYQESPNASQ